MHTYVAPVIDPATLQSIYVQCDTVVSAPVAMAGTLPVTATTDDTVHISGQGTHTITWTFTNGYISATGVQEVIVDDTTAPVADVALPALDVTCPYTLTAPTATDNCTGTVTGTTDSLLFTVAGNYTVQWHYDDGHGNVATQSQQLKVSCSTGINELSVQGAFELYPNPAYSYVTIRSNLLKPGRNYSLSIVTAIGQLAYKGIITTETLKMDLTSLPAGVYMVRITDPETLQGCVQKLIKR